MSKYPDDPPGRPDPTESTSTLKEYVDVSRLTVPHLPDHLSLVGVVYQPTGLTTDPVTPTDPVYQRVGGLSIGPE